MRRLVEASFAKRIMFGFDEMIWPDAIKLAIDGVNSADFLSPKQKRDILYNNAVRFLRFDPASMTGAVAPVRAPINRCIQFDKSMD